VRPCDCKDMLDAARLSEQGLMFNGRSITVRPNVVELKIDSCTLEIPMGLFKSFASWYLADQEEAPEHRKKEYMDGQTQSGYIEY